jgi:hypothetical protein
VLQLNEFLAGRQESSEGILRLAKETSRSYWQLVAELVGRRISLSYEADDERPLWLRLETLTGEHSFFRRLDDKRLDKLVVKKTKEDDREKEIKRETGVSRD